MGNGHAPRFIAKGKNSERTVPRCRTSLRPSRGARPSRDPHGPQVVKIRHPRVPWKFITFNTFFTFDASPGITVRCDKKTGSFRFLALPSITVRCDKKTGSFRFLW